MTPLIFRIKKRIKIDSTQEHEFWNWSTGSCISFFSEIKKQNQKIRNYSMPNEEMQSDRSIRSSLSRKDNSIPQGRSFQKPTLNASQGRRFFLKSSGGKEASSERFPAHNFSRPLFIRESVLYSLFWKSSAHKAQNPDTEPMRGTESSGETILHERREAHWKLKFKILTWGSGYTTVVWCSSSIREALNSIPSIENNNNNKNCPAMHSGNTVVIMHACNCKTEASLGDVVKHYLKKNISNQEDTTPGKKHSQKGGASYSRMWEPEALWNCYSSL